VPGIVTHVSADHAWCDERKSALLHGQGQGGAEGVRIVLKSANTARHAG
jgi:hypothetical protein